MVNRRSFCRLPLIGGIAGLLGLCVRGAELPGVESAARRVARYLADGNEGALDQALQDYAWYRWLTWYPRSAAPDSWHEAARLGKYTSLRLATTRFEYHTDTVTRQDAAFLLLGVDLALIDLEGEYRRRLADIVQPCGPKLYFRRHERMFELFAYSTVMLRWPPLAGISPFMRVSGT